MNFGNQPKPAFGSFGSNATTTTPSFGTTPNAGASNSGFSFGASAAPATSTPAASSFSFGNTAAPATGFGATAAAPATNTGFSFGQSPATPASSIATGFGGAAAPSSGGFTGFGQTSTANTTTPSSTGFSFPNTAPASSAATSAPAFGTSTAAPSLGGFNFGGQTATTAATPSFSLNTANTSTATGAASSAIAGSTAPTFAPTLTTNPTVSGAPATTTTTITPGAPTKPVTVPTPSSLKNKTMEEILNKWTKELDSYSAEFHRQAVEVAEWDRELIENGSKISNLNNDVIKTEALQAEIDQSLSYINAQQEDLSSILDAYEKQMKEVLDESNLQQPMQPADIQREKAYSLAEGLNKQLDDVSRNLNIMIEEVNKMNGTDKSIDDNDGEDNVSQIVKILNAHLTSLQWIDSTTVTMQNKIQEVSKLQEKIERDHQQTLLRR